MVPGGVGLGVGEGPGALEVGGAADHAGRALALGPGGGGDSCALAADLLEDGGSDLLGIVQAAEPAIDDLDAVFASRPARQCGG